ncbi:hydrogenase expression/formation protein [candidate division KSB1 bacterium]|nr:hydrogenase expression/formation protein [candidate division KSB1 bacterium]
MKKSKKFLPTGKLPHEILVPLLEKYTMKPEDVIVGAKIGEDATVIDVGEKYLLAKTDPITFVTDEIGYYTININANDIACKGGLPKWFLATLLLPENNTTRKMVDAIFSQLHKSCEKLNIAFCGGHTEITYGLQRPIIIGMMLGEVEKDKFVDTVKVGAGDDILLTKGIAIEATSIIAREREAELTEMFSSELVQQSKNYLYDPGISVLHEAQIATGFDDIHAMHDPTEGGIAAGLFEIAKAANVGLKIEYDMIDILAECKLLCDVYELDPLGIIASGALLIVCNASVSQGLMEAFEKEEINACRIGKIMPRNYGMKIISPDGEATELPYFAQDEITKFFNDNSKKEEK